jgi:catechol 2,3-dioxygenase-like lactoylglutathione lyase family enzyme
MISAMPRIAIAVHDFDKAIATFRDVFAMPVLDFSPDTVPSVGAHVGMCVPPGGSNIELMAPATPGAPLALSIQGFLDRRGEGLFALMLEAPDPDAEAEVIAGRGLDVLPLMEGAGGRDIHPRSTGGVLIRIYPDNSVADRGPHEIREPALSGIARVVIATADAEAAADAYGGGLGLDVEATTTDDERGVRLVRCRPPRGGRIELVSAVDESRPFARDIAAAVAERGGGLFALVLEAPDPDRAVDVLTERGLAFTTTGGAGPATTVFGTRIILG